MGRKKHIAIVGAGAFGAWTAYYLAKNKHQVTLIDALPPGDNLASSGGQSRIIRSVYGKDELYVKLVKEAFEKWRSFELEWKVKCYYESGVLWMFSGENEQYVRASIPNLQKYGFQLEQWTPSQLEKQYPVLHTKDLSSVYFEPKAGFIKSGEACRHLHKAFQELGGRAIKATAKPGRQNKGHLDHLLLSNGQQLYADEYVFACGPWLPGLFPEVLGDAIQISKMDVFFFKLHQKQQDYSYPHLPIWLEFGDAFYYGIPSDNTLEFKVGDDIRSEVFDPGRDERQTSSWRYEAIESFIKKRFPHLQQLSLANSRVCLYSNTSDGHFIIDKHPEARNVWLAGGGTGHAFKLGPVLGKYLYNRITEEGPEESLFSLKNQRFSTANSQVNFV